MSQEECPVLKIFKVNELATSQYTATMTDENGDPVPLSALEELTLTLYDVESNEIINNRSEQNVLNTNGVTIDAESGLVTWTLSPEDNPILNASNKFERHKAVFVFSYDSVKVGVHEVIIDVKNIARRG